MRNRQGNLVVRTVSALSSIASSLATYFWNSFYSSLDPNRKEVFNGWRPRGGTVHQVIPPSLTGLSSQCRHIERTTPMGRAVAEAHSADIVGGGIGILPNTGDTDRDAKLSKAFSDWADHAMVDGSSLWLWQSLVPRELDTSGNALARVIVLPDRIEKGWIPLALLPLEAEWLSELPVAPVPDDHRFIRGVVIDKYGRPVAYDIRNPETMLTGPGERVPADQIIHVFERRRPQQVLGEPILSTVVERLLQDSRLIETELKAANATAAPAIAITSQAGGMADGNATDDGDPVTDIPAGATVRLYPGEGVESITNNRPSQAIAPFRATIRADVAVACRVSQFHLDHDPSRANYSSMRLDRMMTDRLQASLRETVGVGAAGKPYEAVVSWLMLVAGLAIPEAIEERAALKRYFLRPDKMPYVDPVKDVQASLLSIANNLSTVEQEAAERGHDWRADAHQRAIEDALYEELGLPLPRPEKVFASEVKVDEAADPAIDNTDNNKTLAQEAA